MEILSGIPLRVLRVDKFTLIFIALEADRIPRNLGNILLLVMMV